VISNPLVDAILGRHAYLRHWGHIINLLGWALVKEVRILWRTDTGFGQMIEKIRNLLKKVGEKAIA
jgi:hypothetical protein